jgi:hypothetical protein
MHEPFVTGRLLRTRTVAGKATADDWRCTKEVR